MAVISLIFGRENIQHAQMSARRVLCRKMQDINLLILSSVNKFWVYLRFVCWHWFENIQAIFVLEQRNKVCEKPLSGYKRVCVSREACRRLGLAGPVLVFLARTRRSDMIHWWMGGPLPHTGHCPLQGISVATLGPTQARQSPSLWTDFSWDSSCLCLNFRCVINVYHGRSPPGPGHTTRSFLDKVAILRQKYLLLTENGSLIMNCSPLKSIFFQKLGANNQFLAKS